ncbi:hypothetical protein KC19_2G051400 [Ceratodon purpureus]|uniref:non-specific serine/threonine protein kinase n=1 Tax=Ceratodon purpureus TaxID=3225 RepID=A0A8T0IS91_CERPU|nr:hypothetical protein KC19_2G051400 [Ceratodon purpureus]
MAGAMGRLLDGRCRRRMVSSWSLVVSALLLVSWGLVEAESAVTCESGAVEFFVPRGERGDDSVRVTYRSSLSDERSERGAPFLQCCGWVKVPDESSRSLNCSVFSEDLDVHSNASALPDFCLRINSSLKSYIVTASEVEGVVGHGYCALRADAAVSLSLYLNWFGSDSRVTNRRSFFEPVQTRAECSNDNLPCRLSISTKSIHGSKASRVLGAVEWNGTLSRNQHVLLSQEFIAAFRPQTENPSNEETSVLDFSVSSVRPMLSISKQVEAANVLQLGRRSLLATRAVHRPASQVQWGIIFVTGTLISLAGISMLAILCAGKKEDESPGEFLDTVPILPPRFSYSKLQKATQNYSKKLGDGAFGSVYEGTLPNGIRVAVKMLEKTSVQGEKQFRAEVASMGAIRHLNLVRLHGFCSEGAHRLLVYEYMPNGSLDSWLFGKKQGEKLLDWEQRLNVALGTARALAYLHEECSDHIIHLDVKPENILLDHQFCPKLSDFGLAKLMDREQSRVVTSMRGTPGYLAPEWLLPHAAVTAKTDVYSFGMVLLELISGRENTNFSLGKEQWYFPAWAFKLMGEGRTMELLDKRLHIEEVEYFHKQDAVRAIHVALLCIQDDPASRPAMSRVVHMLQGHVEPEPLNARQSAIQPPRRLVTAFAASVCDTDPINGLKSEKTQSGEKQSTDSWNDSRKNSTDRNIIMDSRKNSSADRADSRKNSWSNDLVQPHDLILSELQNDMRNDHFQKRNDMNLHRAANGPNSTSSRLPVVSESPRVFETPKLPPRPPRHESLEDLNEEDNFKLEPEAPHAVQENSQYRVSHKGDRLAGVHMLGSNPKCIPPWPVKGDVILLRGPQGDFHGVVRDVRVQTKQMRLGLLHRLSSETRWSVREEEAGWRHWNESIRTLDFWVVVRWATIPGRGFEKFPVEWQVK